MTEVPIIMLTARGDVQDRVAGLEAGADDYLAKPFDVAELIARINTVLRASDAPAGEQPAVCDFNSISTSGRHPGETQIDLSTREFDLLATLMRRPRRVFTRDELLDLVWGSDREVAAATVETYILTCARRSTARQTRSSCAPSAAWVTRCAIIEDRCASSHEVVRAEHPARTADDLLCDHDRGAAGLRLLRFGRARAPALHPLDDALDRRGRVVDRQILENHWASLMGA